MKLRKVLLTGLILSGSLFANTLSDTTALIGQMQSVSQDKRFELMNQIKSNVLSLNQNDKAQALKQMREARQTRRANKLAQFKAGLSPEKLAAFEEKLKVRREAKAAHKEKLAKFRASLSDEQRKEMDSIRKGRTTRYKGAKKGRTTRYTGVKKPSNGKIINSKTHTTLTAEQLSKFTK